MSEENPLYVPCPRCRGSRVVFAITRIGSDWRPSVGECFQCPLCYGSAEADAESARHWLAEQQESEDDA